MSYIDNIKTFVRTYDLGSLSAAGRDLRVSAAVVSSRILKLEQHLNTRLFRRTTRKLIPTEQGELFYEKAINVLNTIDDAEQAVQDMTQIAKGSLFLSAPLGVGSKIIAPLLLEFGKENPLVHLRLRLTDRALDIMQDKIDVALYLGRPPDSSLRILSVANCPRVLCAAPSYIAKHGHPETGDDLWAGKKHLCLNLRFPGAREYRWTLQTEEGPKKFTVQGQYETDHSEVLLMWALEGNGVIMRPLFEVQHYLDSGALVQVCKANPPLDAELAFIYNHKRYQDVKVRALMDFLKPRIIEQLPHYNPR